MAWVPRRRNLNDTTMLAAYRLARHRSVPEGLAANSTDPFLKLSHVGLVLHRPDNRQ